MLSTLIELLYMAIKVPVWRSADGRVIPIRKISDQHLANSLSCIERDCAGLRALPPIHQCLEAEARRRGARR